MHVFVINARVFAFRLCEWDHSFIGFNFRGTASRSSLPVMTLDSRKHELGFICAITNYVKYHMLVFKEISVLRRLMVLEDNRID